MASRASSDVVVRFIGDTGDLSKGLDGLKGRFQAVTTSLQGIAAAGAVVGAVTFFKSAIEQASDLNEATSKTGVIFGKAADDIEKFASTAADAIGQSKTQAMDAASTFATFGKAAGLTGKELSGFSTDLVTLASDLASFHNADPSEVIEALGAGLRGEAEPMQRFGVLLNDAQMRNAALAMGLIKTTKEALTPQQKVLAAQKVIMEQTSDAQGDFARTSDGLANSQRTLTARYDDAQAMLGQKFLPIAQEVTHVMADGVLPAVAGVGDVLSNTLVPVVGTAFDVVKSLAGAFGELPGPVQAGALALVAWKVAGGAITDQLATLRSGTRGFGDDVRTAMGAFDVNRLTGTFMALEERVPVLSRMGAAFRETSSLGIGLGTSFGGLTGAVTTFGAVTQGVGAASLVGLKAAAAGAMSMLGGPFGVALGVVTLGLTAFANRGAEAEARQRGLTEASKGVAKALQEENNQLNRKTRQSAASALEEAGLLELAEKHAVNTSLLTDAYLGNNDARKQVNAGIKGQIAGLREIEAAQVAAYEEGDELASRDVAITRQKIADLEATKSAIDGAIGTRQQESAAIERTAAASREESAAKTGVAGETSRLMGSEQAFQEVLAESGLEYDANKTRLENLLDALKAYNNEVIGSTDSEEGWFAALDQLTTGIAENGSTLDIHTQKGRDNRDALEELSSKTKQLYIDNINAGMSVEEATAIYDRNMQQVYATADALGFNDEQARHLIETYGRVPRNVVTEYTTKGYEEVWAKLQSLSAGQILGEKGLPVTPANVRAVQKDLKMGRFRDGGEVDGPYVGARADNVRAWLTPGEVVESNAAGDYYGRDFLLALNDRKIPRESLPQFAGGGVVWPFPMDVSKTKVPAQSVGAFPAADPNAARGPGGPGMGWQNMWAVVKSRFGNATLNSAFRRGDPGYHGRGRAIDIGGPMAAINRWLAGAYPNSTELIYTPGINLWHGRPHTYKAATRADHYDHVHWAMANGGLVGKPGGFKDGGWLGPGKLGFNETSRPEPVLSTSQWEDVGGLVEGLRALVAVLEKNTGQSGKVINVGGIHVANRPTDVMQQLRFAEMMAGV